jgi:hypothetical protein
MAAAHDQQTSELSLREGERRFRGRSPSKAVRLVMRQHIVDRLIE